MRSSLKPQALTIKAIVFVFLAICSGMGRGYAANLIYVNEYSNIVTYDVSKATANEVLNSRTVFATTGFSEGGELAFDSSGNLYSGNMAYGTALIKEYNNSGSLVKSSDYSANSNGVAGIAFNSSGNLFLASPWQSGPAIYNNSGTYLGLAPISTTEQFAIDQSNNFYTGYGKFNAAGSLVKAFNLPTPATYRGVTLDNSGNIYVAAYSDNHVIKLDSTGNIIGTFGDSSNLSSPRLLAVDSEGNFYATGAGYSISKFNSAGVFQYKWTSYAQGMAFAPASVPEPSTYALAVIASGVMAVIANRRRKGLTGR